MIYETTLDQAFRFGNLVAGMHSLRKSIFVDAQGWGDIPVIGSMEYDQFDTLEARYLIGIDKQGIVRAVCRNLFCDRPWMLKSLWADKLAPGQDLPSSRLWAEGTRMCIDQSLPDDQYMMWQAQMSCAGTEWALHHGVTDYTFVTYARVAKHLEKALPIEYWGDPVQFPDGEFVAGHWHISEELLERQRKLTGITRSVFVPLEDLASTANLPVAA